MKSSHIRHVACALLVIAVCLIGCTGDAAGRASVVPAASDAVIVSEAAGTASSSAESASASGSSNNSEKSTAYGCSSLTQIVTGAFSSSGASESEFVRVNALDVTTYDGELAVEVNGGIPDFTQADLERDPFEEYSELDRLGRCGPAFALVGPDTLSTAPRGSIGEIRPSGWRIARYEWIEGEYLFNRCHLIGYQLTGQNDNELNLITGTRSMNTLGMEPYECEVASYVRYTGNHVLYRVTPVFEGKNLVASGVLMEAQSVEDDGAGIQFCVWCYNVEPGVEINYANGRNRSTGEMEGTVLPSESVGEVSNASASSAETSDQAVSGDLSYNYVLNTNSHKIHLPDCPSVAKMSERSKRYFEGTLEEARAEGYEPCGVCCP